MAIEVTLSGFHLFGRMAIEVTLSGFHLFGRMAIKAKIPQPPGNCPVILDGSLQTGKSIPGKKNAAPVKYIAAQTVDFIWIPTSLCYITYPSVIGTFYFSDFLFILAQIVGSVNDIVEIFLFLWNLHREKAKILLKREKSNLSLETYGGILKQEVKICRKISAILMKRATP